MPEARFHVECAADVAQPFENIEQADTTMLGRRRQGFVDVEPDPVVGDYYANTAFLPAYVKSILMRLSAFDHGDEVFTNRLKQRDENVVWRGSGPPVIREVVPDVMFVLKLVAKQFLYDSNPMQLSEYRSVKARL